MKRWIIVAIMILLLCSCSANHPVQEQVLSLRASLSGKQCNFDAEITADYGDKIYEFALACQIDQDGNLTFSVRKPESIAGISGNITTDGGKLTFDDVALSFPLLTDGHFSPISAPWVVMKALRSGYITSSCVEGDFLRATINDSYAEDAMTVDLWMDENSIPVRGEILWKNRRILTIEIDNFQIL